MRSFAIAVAVAVLTCTGGAAQSPAPPTYLFDFGGNPAPGFTSVLPTATYSTERGYGFEPGAKIIRFDQNGTDPLCDGFSTGNKPFSFSVAVPEGNYRVAVTLGDQSGESTTTVKAELRRLMLEKVQTPAGKFETRTFVVNVRTPRIATGGEVKLKDREKTTEFGAWDEKVTLEFNNARPCLCALRIERADDVPTVYLLGDSTVCDQPTEPFNSWGQMLTRFFRSGVAVANHAESGESLRSSLGARRLDKVVSLMKPGDYLFIQYGHNDMKAVDAAAYKSDLKRFVAAARSKGGIPVLLTPMHRRTFQGPAIINSHRDFPDAARAAATEDNVPLIDLHAMSKTLYEALGPEKSGMLFKPGDGTHHSNYGSYQLAKCVVEGIGRNRLDLVRFLVDDVPAYDPSRPDPPEKFSIPASPPR